MSGRARWIVCLAAAGLLGSLAGTARAAIPTLYVNYNSSNCTFQVTNDAGSTFTTLPPGGYDLSVSTGDPYALVGGSAASLVNCGGWVQFSAIGPGVNVMTTLGQGDASNELDPVKLQAGGVYTLEDASNIAGSKTIFTVSTTGLAGSTSAAGTSSSSTGGSSSPSLIGSQSGVGLKFAGTLNARVNAAGKVSLTHNGKAVVSLKAGKYTLSVGDKSAKAGFSIQAPGAAAQALTSASFVGSHSVTVSVKQGKWSFFAPGGPKTRFSVV